MVRLEGFEPATYRLEGGCSIPVSYTHLGVTLDNAEQGLYTLRVALQYKGDPIEVALTIQ